MSEVGYKRVFRQAGLPATGRDGQARGMHWCRDAYRKLHVDGHSMVWVAQAMYPVGFGQGSRRKVESMIRAYGEYLEAEEKKANKAY